MILVEVLCGIMVEVVKVFGLSGEVGSIVFWSLGRYGFSDVGC